MITDVAGVRVGHWTDAVARTGCTVVLLPEGTVASGEVRGGAPGTREFALLSPERLVTTVDAVVLAGGSAFGLAACDGVVRWCGEHERGFATAAGRVPIVVGAVLFDLAVGDAGVRPGPAEGYAACASATSGPFPLGAVGAGTGATVAKWRGREHARPGGIGSATERAGDLVVSALVAVNAFGDVRGGPVTPGEEADAAAVDAAGAFENTTIGVVATNARLDKTGCLLVAQGAHDGLARALDPAHATVDGDAFVAAATGEVEAPVDRIRLLAARAVEAAIRSAVAPSG
ncbi:MAG TPA: P1 family peptidase [Acidimicrobiales bacterium]|nr:P1 family peptidase [Acidimicrobiales bacterium]